MMNEEKENAAVFNGSRIAYRLRAVSGTQIELVAFIAYVLLGPAMWCLFTFGMIKGRKRMMNLRRPAPRLAEPPRVTILIPAKDEAERIRSCIESALAQDYPNFSVIAIDDRSVDGTGKVLDELAAENPRLRVMHIAEGSLPEGWTGKTNALHQAVPDA